MGDFPLIFLGAGASTKFDIPAIRQMTREFGTTYPRYKKKLDLIIKKLKRLGFAPNIENILSFARGQAHPKQALLNSSPFVANFVDNSTIQKLGYDPGAKALIRDIQEFIFQKCLITENYKIELIVDHYSHFFEYLKTRFNVKGQLEDRSVSVDIFTTNYDNVIEQYGYATGINVFTGYEPTADGTCKFSPEFYDESGPIRLYKLHGSVTLGLVENKKTKEKAVIESTSGIKVGVTYRKKWKVIDRVMIYGYEKDPSQEPYFDLLYLLRKRLEKVDNVLVIGYSFSDKPILNVFKHALDSRSDFKMIILNKKASKIKKSLFANSRKVRSISLPFSKFRRI